MTDKFHVWFWNRRSDSEKFFMSIIPADILFVLACQFTAWSGPAILILTLVFTMFLTAIFCSYLFVSNEYKTYRQDKEDEAEEILRTLRGEATEDYMFKRKKLRIR